jgi:hypothetical protein
LSLYRQIIDVARPENAPLGYVNVPAWLTPRIQTYPLTKEGVTGLPLYTDVRQLVRVNRGGTLAVDNVMYVHTLYEPREAYFGFHGDWLEGAETRQFALDHASVWLTRYRESAKTGKRFELQQVGTISSAAEACAGTPLVRWDAGPDLLSAEVKEVEAGCATVALTWRATGPVQAHVLLHVVDAQHALVAQADGPALGGMVPPNLWQPGDCIYDLRTVDLPDDTRPLTILVGFYDAQGRFPAYLKGERVPDDAAPVGQILR